MISKLTDIVGKPNVGEGTVIEDYVAIGKNVVIGHHVVIHTGTIIGNDVRIDDFACIGKLPLQASIHSKTGKNGKVKHGVDFMRASTEDPAKRCIIGNNVIIGTGAILYQGAHIGQDSVVSDRACLREGVNLGERSSVGCGAYLAAHAELEPGTKVAVGEVVSRRKTEQEG